MEYFSFMTPLGRMTGKVDQGLCLLDLREDAYPAPCCGLAREVERQVREYFEGKRRVFDLPLQTIGTEFQQRVWQALRGIPWGEVRTYAQVAEQIGCPGGARAVGNACGKNPVLIVTPCHRVLGGKDLGGFRCGPQVKRALLRLEGYGTA